jgi:hypothetical protein
VSLVSTWPWQSSRTQFGVSINVWRLAGDTLNTTCNFLYRNNQVHRDCLIAWMFLKIQRILKVSNRYLCCLSLRMDARDKHETCTATYKKIHAWTVQNIEPQKALCRCNDLNLSIWPSPFHVVNAELWSSCRSRFNHHKFQASWNSKWADKYENNLRFKLIWRKIWSYCFGNRTNRPFQIHNCQAKITVRFKKQMHPVLLAKDTVAFLVRVYPAIWLFSRFACLNPKESKCSK